MTVTRQRWLGIEELERSDSAGERTTDEQSSEELSSQGHEVESGRMSGSRSSRSSSGSSGSRSSSRSGSSTHSNDDAGRMVNLEVVQRLRRKGEGDIHGARTDCNSSPGHGVALVSPSVLDRLRSRQQIRKGCTTTEGDKPQWASETAAICAVSIRPGVLSRLRAENELRRLEESNRDSEVSMSKKEQALDTLRREVARNDYARNSVRILRNKQHLREQQQFAPSLQDPILLLGEFAAQLPRAAQVWAGASPPQHDAQVDPMVMRHQIERSRHLREGYMAFRSRTVDHDR